jgi:hypothetical protein
MTKKLFIETMDVIIEQHEHDMKCAEAFQIILPDSFHNMYNNYKLYSQLIKMLRIQMSDDTNESWIDYYVDELDFGRLWRPGKVTMAGKDIKLQTPDDLWKLLTSNTPKNKE